MLLEGFFIRSKKQQVVKFKSLEIVLYRYCCFEILHGKQSVMHELAAQLQAKTISSSSCELSSLFPASSQHDWIQMIS